jgi:16S rRNA G527 N7-methylase RsmG
MAREAAEKFDLVLLRAVTEIAGGMTAAAPLIGKAGTIVFYKTSQTPATELREGERLACHFKLKPLPPVQVTIAGGAETYERVLIAFCRST